MRSTLALTALTLACAPQANEVSDDAKYALTHYLSAIGRLPEDNMKTALGDSTVAP